MSRRPTKSLRRLQTPAESQRQRSPCRLQRTIFGDVRFPVPNRARWYSPPGMRYLSKSKFIAFRQLPGKTSEHNNIYYCILTFFAPECPGQAEKPRRKTKQRPARVARRTSDPSRNTDGVKAAKRRDSPAPTRGHQRDRTELPGGAEGECRIGRQDGSFWRRDSAANHQPRPYAPRTPYSEQRLG